MAKDAQVVFTDMGIGEAGALSPPADLGRYFSWGWGLGARVFSESWGTSQNSYDILAESEHHPLVCHACSWAGWKGWTLGTFFTITRNQTQASEAA